MNEQFAANAGRIRERVAAAANRAGRSPDDVTIVAVSKTFPRENIDLAYENGFRVFGESRVQEIRAKFADAPLPHDARLHLIGSLQSNKIKQVLPYLDVLETVDRKSLVEALGKELAKTGGSLDVLLQVNISGEEQKSGVTSADGPALLQAILDTEGLVPRGLMTMAPLGADETALRTVFGGLRLLRDRLQDDYGVALPTLSMGMSDDFEIAIEEGATHVRLGRSLFGAR